MSVVAFLATRFKLPPWLIEAALAGLIILGFALYERHQGAVKCESADAKVALAQKAAQDAQKAIDDQRLKDANDAHQVELDALKRARDTQPVPHLVCHEARPQSVPATAAVPETQPSGPGPLPPKDEAGFDPGPGALALADEADSVLADCRELDSAVRR